MKKHTFKKFVSLAMAGVMTLALGSGAFATTVAENNTPVKSVNELAYMDVESASPELRDDILSARAQIVFSKAWTADGPASILHKDGTVEELPNYFDLFPGWDLSEICSFEPEPPCDGVITASSPSLFYQGNVWLDSYAGEATEPFYQFNGSGNPVYVWAQRFSAGMDKTCNIGFTDMNSGEYLYWTPGVAQGEQITLYAKTSVRYGVRASAPAGTKAGYAVMIVSEDKDPDLGVQG